jgi:hypothetical protein
VFRPDINDTLSDISVDVRSQVSEDASDNERRVRMKRNPPSCSSGSLDGRKDDYLLLDDYRDGLTK